MEHALSLSPLSKIFILGDFNVHHRLRPSSNFKDLPGEQAFNLAIINDLEKLVQHSTRTPDCSGDQSYILNIFPNLSFQFL